MNVAIPKLNRNYSTLGCPLKNNEPEYVVDDTPLPEKEGVLQLKLPIPLYSEDGSENVKNISKIDAASPYYRPHLPTNSVITYEPLTEESAFLKPTTVDRLIPTHFLIPRGVFSIQKIINMIRTVIVYNDDLDEFITKDYQWFGPQMNKSMFTTTLVYNGDDLFSSRYAKMRVRLRAVENPESIAVEVLHIRGDTRICMIVFKTIRDYVLSNGNAEYKLQIPDFKQNWSDEYYLTMHDAN